MVDQETSKRNRQVRSSLCQLPSLTASVVGLGSTPRRGTMTKENIEVSKETIRTIAAVLQVALTLLIAARVFELL